MSTKSRFLLVLCCLPIACDDATSDAPPSGMTLTLQVLDPVQRCWRFAAGDPTPAAYGDECADEASGAVRANTGTLRAAVSFGDIEFDVGKARPVPSFALALNGQPLTLVVESKSVAPARASARSGYFVGAFPTPALVGQLSVSATVQQGFSRGPVSVSLDCPHIEVSVTCPSSADCTFPAGSRSIIARVRADGTAAASATISRRLDDVHLAEISSVALAPDPEQLGKLVSMPVEITPPALTSASQARLSLLAQIGSCVSASSAPVILIPPAASVAVLECAGQTTCTLPAGQGVATVEIRLPGKAKESAVVVSKIDGAEDGSPSPVTLDVGLDHQIVGTVSVPVPLARRDAKWALALRRAGVDTPAALISLQAPTVRSTLEPCVATSPCVLPVGVFATATVTVPHGLRVDDAQFFTRLDGRVETRTASFSRDDLAADTKTAYQVLQIPDAPGRTWLVDSSVAGYPGNTWAVSIVAPPTDAGADSEP